MLWCQLKLSIQRKLCGLSPSGMRLQHDNNAQLRTAHHTVKQIQDSKFEVLYHLPHSPDLALNNFYLFCLLKDTKWTSLLVRWGGKVGGVWLSSSSYSVSLYSGCTSALGLLCDPKYSNQYRFNNPVPLINRHRSLTEAVLISFGSTSGFPKTL